MPLLFTGIEPEHFVHKYGQKVVTPFSLGRLPHLISAVMPLMQLLLLTGVRCATGWQAALSHKIHTHKWNCNESATISFSISQWQRISLTSHRWPIVHIPFGRHKKRHDKRRKKRANPHF